MQDQVSLLNYIVQKDRLNKRESEVYNALKCLGGRASSWELMDMLVTSNPNVVRPRLTGLLKKGLIEKCGKQKREINGLMIVENIWRVKTYGN